MTQVASLSPTEIEEILAEIGHREDEAMRENLLLVLLAAALGGAAWTAGDLGLSQPSVTRRTQRIRDLEGLRTPAINRINETTRRRLRRGLQAAATRAELTEVRMAARNAVSRVFAKALGIRTDTIGTSEGGIWWSTGAHLQMQEAGIPASWWLTMRDSQVRDSHGTMDGQCRAIGEAFVSGTGARLMYPGDPAAPASEVINCRCLEVPLPAGCESRAARRRLVTAGQKVAYWKAAEDARGPHERRVRVVLRRRFRLQRDRVRTALERALRE